MCQSSVVVHSMGNECHLVLKDKTTISIRSQYDLISSTKHPVTSTFFLINMNAQDKTEICIETGIGVLRAELRAGPTVGPEMTLKTEP
ncbi:hypothetical protein EVAR_58075_1 [Eumeta japonica]|uniref:Uncharacterized protein n=1 Tax=Eumeta variegata TaxID=151549 RepID=A0A4C1ZCS6_EUMVA|nr:hypothetical protein EVAR_58075_1 [Eumeta japonica]